MDGMETRRTRCSSCGRVLGAVQGWRWRITTFKSVLEDGESGESEESEDYKAGEKGRGKIGIKLRMMLTYTDTCGKRCS